MAMEMEVLTESLRIRDRLIEGEIAVGNRIVGNRRIAFIYVNQFFFEPNLQLIPRFQKLRENFIMELWRYIWTGSIYLLPIFLLQLRPALFEQEIELCNFEENGVELIFPRTFSLIPASAHPADSKLHIPK